MIVFKNSGTIDVKSITTFGVSSKENKSAIGYFGTGLKYAIAILLREGCEITIYTGGVKYEFSTLKQTVRVDEFTFVTMNDEPLAFTTELGQNWELWQAFRELYCNCTDEGGSIYISDSFDALESDTVILASGSKLDSVWAIKDQIILPTQPIDADSTTNRHQGESDYIYYKGIRVHHLNKPTIFTYDLRTAELTEDRTLKNVYAAAYYIKNHVAYNSDKAFIKSCLTADSYFLEHDFEYSGGSDEFMEVAKGLVKSMDMRLNKSAKALCKDYIMEAMAESKKENLTSIEQIMLDKAIRFNKGLGFDVDRYDIIVSEFLGENVLGQAYNGKIYIAKRTFMQGTKQVAATLLEEYLHIKEGFEDETYKFQTYLFDLICTLGEQLNGEPL